MNLRAMKRSLIYLAGDIHRERCPFGFAWGKGDRSIDYPEMEKAVLSALPGYIGLHRNKGDLSNKAIPGFAKHAWLWTEDSKIIIEAVSEGVLKRHTFHALNADYAVILKPLVVQEALPEAVTRANQMVGCPYDDTFTFDLEIEASLFQDKETALLNMKRFGLGVSCTEMVALCYVGHRRELGLYRTKMGKRQVILPDAYLSTHFEIVWASKETTPGNAQKLGLHEEGCSMLKEYWKG